MIAISLAPLFYCLLEDSRSSFRSIARYERKCGGCISRRRRVKILAARTGTCAIPAKRGSIFQAMMVVALAAMSLAVLREMPLEALTFPTIWVLLGAIDFVIAWKLILKQSLRAFHYVFLVVFVIASFVTMNLVATERIHPLGRLVRWYQPLAGANTISVSPGFLWIGELWMACFLSLMLALFIGLVATWLERRRDWDIAAFWRGALIGFGIAGLLLNLAWRGAEPSSVQMISRVVVLGVGIVLGGRMGLSRLKSNRPRPKVQSGKAEVSL
jgi:hypothetical protein